MIKSQACNKDGNKNTVLSRHILVNTSFQHIWANGRTEHCNQIVKTRKKGVRTSLAASLRFFSVADKLFCLNFPAALDVNENWILKAGQVPRHLDSATFV